MFCITVAVGLDVDDVIETATLDSNTTEDQLGAGRSLGLIHEFLGRKIERIWDGATALLRPPPEALVKRIRTTLEMNLEAQAMSAVFKIVQEIWQERNKYNNAHEHAWQPLCDSRKLPDEEWKDGDWNWKGEVPAMRMLRRMVSG